MDKPIAPWWFTSALQSYVTVMTSVILIVIIEDETGL